MSIKSRFFGCLERLVDFIFEDVLGVHDMEDTSDMEEYLREVDSPPPIIKDDKQLDKETPNLFVSRFIKDSNITCEVISCDEGDFRVMILKIQWDRLGTYLNVGQTYPLRLVYESKNGEMKIWEVDPDTMKRTTSQVLLTWERDVGWSWDIDF